MGTWHICSKQTSAVSKEMGKSVVIIGKGPSVLKSTREYVESFDLVAICNFPPIEGYEQYIGTKADFHFFNAHDPNPYKKEILNSLGLKAAFNTHYKEHRGYSNCFPDHEVKYISGYGAQVVPKFKKKYGFDPSTAVQAFEYFVTKEEYQTIGLVGFDFFKVVERGYYYPVNEVQQSHKYLYRADGTKPFYLEWVRVQENSHDSKKSERFINYMVRYHNKELRVV